MSRSAVFLDRDGVLNAAPVRNGRPRPPASLTKLRILPGVAESCHTLVGAGFLLIVVSNQPDIARGTQDEATVQAMNAHLKRTLNVDEVLFCPHDDADECLCRKPRPGMILDAARRWNVDLHRSFTVGDRWRDIEAGKAAGTRTIFIDRRYDEPTPLGPDLTVDELKESVAWIIETAEHSS
jgi:D-glycero-D-manno-heptose 1,7-bisphosphate phosphatase